MGARYRAQGGARNGELDAHDDRRRVRADDAGARATLEDLRVHDVLDELDRELVALSPVKTRIREIAALLVIDRLRENMGLSAERPSLHMCFTGNPGTGKTTVALRVAEILHRLGYIETARVVSVTRDDLVGQYVGHTAPKTKEILKRAYGGVLFIDEAYYLYRPENERDYGQEADRDAPAGDGGRALAARRRARRLPRSHGHVLPLEPGHELARSRITSTSPTTRSTS